MNDLVLFVTEDLKLTKQQQGCVLCERERERGFGWLVFGGGCGGRRIPRGGRGGEVEIIVLLLYPIS
jgi:hypothetical protein